MQGDTFADRSSAPDPERIGRFVITGRLGEGGMGVVYSGYDGELGRPVALKLMHAALDADDGARPRLLREAQALARLSHPNVVQIFEFGHHAGRLFVAMEYVHGKTLQAWLREPGGLRPWRQLLDVFIAAGRGLAAAHAVGLVHRDFKPSNVMIGVDGRVRVLDFGLVGSTVDEDQDATSFAARALPSQPTLSALRTSLTLTGEILGTPAYMAPEQYRGLRCDARTDQFSFCVALYEALYGSRPFAGESVWEVLEAGERAQIRSAPAHSRVPAWLRAAVVRGLSPDPAKRWPSMAALLAEFERDRSRAACIRRKLGAAVVTLGAGLWVSTLRAPTTGELCDAELAGSLADVWDEHTAEALPPAARARVEALIQTWMTARRELCAATLQGGLSAVAFHRGEQCLENYRRVFLRLGRQFDAGATGVALEELPERARIAACSDPSNLARDTSPATLREHEAVRRIEDTLADAQVALITGRYGASEAMAASAVRGAQQVDHPPTLAAALYHLALAQDYGPRAAQVGETLAQADLLAAEHDLPDLAADIALRRLRFATYGHGVPSDGRVWFEVLRGRLARLGLDDDPRETEGHGYLGNIALQTGDLVAAEAEYRLALLAPDGGSPFRRTPALVGLGNILLERAQLEAAEQQFADAQAIVETELGPAHPKNVPPLLGLIAVHLAQGRLDVADREARRAMELVWPDPRSCLFSRVYFYAARVAEDRGESTRARELGEAARRAMRGVEPRTGQRRYHLQILDLVGRMTFQTGGAAAALAPYLELLESETGAEPAEGAALAIVYANAAELAAEARADELVLRFVDAARTFLDHLAPALGDEVLVDLALFEGRALLHGGRAVDAAMVLRGAVTVWDPEGKAADSRAASLHFALFEALKADAPVLARPHALRARDLLARDRPVRRRELGEVDAWLCTHPMPARTGIHRTPAAAGSGSQAKTGSGPANAAVSRPPSPARRAG